MEADLKVELVLDSYLTLQNNLEHPRLSKTKPLNIHIDDLALLQGSISKCHIISRFIIILPSQRPLHNSLTETHVKHPFPWHRCRGGAKDKNNVK